MRFLVFNNESGLGTAKELIINWESIKYIKPDTASQFNIFLNNGSSMEFQVNAGNSSDIIEAINTAIKSRSNSNKVIPIQQKSIGAFSLTSVSAPVAPAGGGGVDGKSSVYVSGAGTPAQNGTDLINGYTAAVAKIQNISSVNSKSIAFSQNLGSGNYRLFEGSPGEYAGART